VVLLTATSGQALTAHTKHLALYINCGGFQLTRTLTRFYGNNLRMNTGLRLIQGTPINSGVYLLHCMALLLTSHIYVDMAALC